MQEAPLQKFQILAPSGGGFRGLYTAKILADLEEEIGSPVATKFDLIAGTSVGTILALAIAMEIPASKIVDLFAEHGRNTLYIVHVVLFCTVYSRWKLLLQLKNNA